MENNTKQIVLNNVVEVLLEKFPEFKSSEKYYDETDRDSPYLVLGGLSLMAFENIDGKNDISLAERLVSLTDNILNDPNSEAELINLFVIEVFEVLTGSKTGANLAKRLLHGKSLELLDQTIKYYHTEEFLQEYKQ